MLTTMKRRSPYIGAALYDLRSHMEELQEALHLAVLLDAPEGEEKTLGFADTFQEPEKD